MLTQVRTSYPGALANPGTYYPGVVTNPGTSYPGALANPGTYYPGVVANLRRYLLSELDCVLYTCTCAPYGHAHIIDDSYFCCR